VIGAWKSAQIRPYRRRWRAGGTIAAGRYRATCASLRGTMTWRQCPSGISILSSELTVGGTYTFNSDGMGDRVDSPLSDGQGRGCVRDSPSTMTPTLVRAILLAIALFVFGRAQAKGQRSPDLVPLITCTAESKQARGFMMELAGDTGLPKSWGWRETASGTSFLKVYTLPSPITVFGQKTSRIAFSASGIMALVGAPVRQLAGKLGLKLVTDSGSTLIFGKTVRQSRETLEGSTIVETVSLNVSTSEVVGATLAGCSYALDVQ
jgi:hypothetical protein